MKFIDLERLEEEIAGWPPGNPPYATYTPQKWHDHLNKAKTELENASDGEARNKIFARYSHLWSYVKSYLSARSYGTCWYCETKVHSYPGDIDHYRPKGRVDKVTDHPGYWWLAFEWRNWRFVCRYCNSLNKDTETGEVSGKADKFPLLDNNEHRRIKNPADYDEYDDLWSENPALLDPTEQQDTGLITFTSEGVPEPSEPDQERITYKRAKISIEAYFLDSSRLKNERKRIYVRVKRLVEKYNRHMCKWETEHNRSDYTIARDAGRALGRMIAPDAEYSMTAISYLQQYLQLYPDWTWINKILASPSVPVHATVYVSVADIDPSTDNETEASS